MSKRKSQNHVKGRSVVMPPTINAAPPTLDQAPSYLSPTNIRRAADAQVDLATRPTLNALDQQSNQVAVQGAGIEQRIGDMYGALSKQIAGSLDQYNHNAAGQSAALQGIGDSLAAGTSSDQQGAQARLAADTAARGGGLDGGASKALAADAAATNARVSGDRTFQATQQSQSQDAYRGLISAMAAGLPVRGADMAAQAGANTTRALSDIAGKRTDILAQRGDMRAKAIGDLNQQAFNNYATVQGLNLQGNKQAIDLAMGQANTLLKTADLNEHVTHDATTEGIAQQNANTAGERADISWGNLKNAQDKLAWQKHRAAYIDAHPNAGLSAYQKAQFRKGNDAVRTAIESVGHIGDVDNRLTYKDKDGKTQKYTRDQVYADLLKKFHNDSTVVDAGIALAHGTLAKHPELIQALKDRHIGVPKRWVRTQGYTPAKGA
jgi:hypothetical protein